MLRWKNVSVTARCGQNRVEKMGGVEARSVSGHLGLAEPMVRPTHPRQRDGTLMDTNWQRRLVAAATAASLAFALFLVVADSVLAASVDPEFLPGASNTDKTCATNEGSGQSWVELKLDGGSLSNGVHSDGTLSVTIANLTSNSFDWSSNIGVDAVIVKTGADGTNLYRYDPPLESTGDTNLITPGNNGISHISFCYDDDPTTTTTAPVGTSTTAPVETTTSAPVETTTSAPVETTTSIPDEVLPTVVTTTVPEEVLPTAATTTTVPAEVLPTEVSPSTLPFTGLESEGLSLIAMALAGAGILFLVASRTSPRDATHWNGRRRKRTRGSSG